MRTVKLGCLGSSRRSVYQFDGARLANDGGESIIFRDYTAADSTSVLGETYPRLCTTVKGKAGSFQRKLVR